MFGQPARHWMRLSFATGLLALSACADSGPGSRPTAATPKASVSPEFRPAYSFRPPFSVAPRFTPQRVTWSASGTEIAVSDPFCHAVRIFDARGEYLGLVGPTAPWDAKLEQPMGVAYSPDGTRLAITDMVNNRVCLFTSSGDFLTLLRAKGGGADAKIPDPWDVAFSPDGEFIAVSRGGLYDKNGNFLRTLGAAGSGVSFFPDGKRLAFVQSGRTAIVKVVDLQGVQLNAFGTWMGPGQENVPGLMYLPMGISCSPDGETIAIADERLGRLFFFSAEGSYLYSCDGKDGNGPERFGSPRGIAFSPDGSKLALVDVKNQRVMVFEKN